MEKLSKLELLLTQYIIENHPQLISDETFIKEKAETAAKAFEIASREGLVSRTLMRKRKKYCTADCYFLCIKR